LNSENDVASHGFQIGSFIYDPAVWPNDSAIVRLNAARVRTITFDARFRPFVLNLHERLLILRTISHDALIVCQTNDQVKPGCSFLSPEHQPQKLRV
jgi:hypothetical protein